MDQSLADTARSDEASLRAGRSAAEMQFASVARAHMQRLRLRLHAELGGLEVKRQQAAAEYQRAFREREVLDTLYTQQRHTHEREQLQHDQRELDASHLLQLWRKHLG
jgi:hypothetical protein